MAFQASPRRRCYPVPRPCSAPALGGGAFQGEPSLLLNCETHQFRPCYHLCFCAFTRNHGESATWASLFPALPGTQDSPSVGAWLVLACPWPCHSVGPVTHSGTAQSSASWRSVLLGAEVAVTKHTSLYFESGDSTADQVYKGWFTDSVFSCDGLVEFLTGHCSLGLVLWGPKPLVIGR